MSSPCSAPHRQMNFDWQSEKTVILKWPFSCSIKGWKSGCSQLTETDHLAILTVTSRSSSHWSTRGGINGLLWWVHFTCCHFDLEVVAFLLPSFWCKYRASSLPSFGDLNRSLQEGVHCVCSDYHLAAALVSGFSRLKVPPRKSSNLTAATNNSGLPPIKTRKALSNFMAQLVCLN